jgi:hypothetical protein
MRLRALSLLVVCLIVLVIGVAPSIAQFYQADGAVELPNGDRLPDFPVAFYNLSGWLIGSTYTNSAGVWQYSFYDCNVYVTACVGPYRPYGTTECQRELIQCSGVTHFDTIVLECGGPKQPPCPHP